MPLGSHYPLPGREFTTSPFPPSAPCPQRVWFWSYRRTPLPPGIRQEAGLASLSVIETSCAGNVRRCARKGLPTGCSGRGRPSCRPGPSWGSALPWWLMARFGRDVTEWGRWKRCTWLALLRDLRPPDSTWAITVGWTQMASWVRSPPDSLFHPLQPPGVWRHFLLSLRFLFHLGPPALLPP